MVIKEEEFPKFPLLDANNELIRLGRSFNTQLDENSLRNLIEDDQIDDQYQILLSYLLSGGENSNPCMNNDIKKEKKRSKHDDENDPQYEDYLKHLKEEDVESVKEENHEEKPRTKVKHTCETSKGKNHECKKQYDRKKKQKIEVTDLEKGTKEVGDSDVEVLDEDACIMNGNANPFVPSKGFSKSMRQHDACDAFRKAVVSVLKKPYDKEEYTGHAEAIRAGNYFDYHPDLQSKLKKYQYNRRKRLAILRGFFFWLQNLTQEGAFKPWKDCACLAVEPPDNGKRA